MEIAISLSALPPSQYRNYVKGWKPNKTLLSLFEKISGKTGRKAMRIYIDPKSDTVVNNIKQGIKPPKIVEDELSSRGIQIIDYVAGAGKDSHGRIVRIGRALKSPDAKREFDSDPNRKALVNAAKGKQLVCISMHPYDIAGMSTDRGWTSCMDLVKGVNSKFVKQDVANDVIIAYLISENDRNINKPIARALIKPYYEDTPGRTARNQKVGSSKVNARYIVDFAYPDARSPFVYAIQDWLDSEINPFIDAGHKGKGVFNLHPKLYPDLRSETYTPSIEDPLMRGDVSGLIATIKKKGIDSKMTRVILDHLNRYPELALISVDPKLKADPLFYVNLILNLSRSSSTETLSKVIAKISKMNLPMDKILKTIDKNLEDDVAFASILQMLPKKNWSEFKESFLEKKIPFTYDTDHGINGNALSEIWNFSKNLPEPEKVFWYFASRINYGEYTPWMVDDHYEYEEEDYKVFVLGASLVALQHRTGESPAGIDSLNRNKKDLNPEYVKTAKMVLDGAQVSLTGIHHLTDTLVARLKKEKIPAAKQSAFIKELEWEDMFNSVLSEFGAKVVYHLEQNSLYVLIECSRSWDLLLPTVESKIVDEAFEFVKNSYADSRTKTKKSVK